MNNALRYLVIALVLVAGLFVLSVCADGLCSASAHVFDNSAGRSKPLLRLARRLRAFRASAAALALTARASASRTFTEAYASFAPLPALARVASLRV